MGGTEYTPGLGHLPARNRLLLVFWTVPHPLVHQWRLARLSIESIVVLHVMGRSLPLLERKLARAQPLNQHLRVHRVLILLSQCLRHHAVF